MRSKLIGRAGIFTTRVTASPLSGSWAVTIVLRWKLDNWMSMPCEVPIRCEFRITREVCTPDPSRWVAYSATKSSVSIRSSLVFIRVQK